jgi:hypothetical protein
MIMAWDDEMPIIVRGLIQDWGTPPTYTDDQINQIVLIAAQSVQTEATFTEAYAVDVVNATVAPDFTDRTDAHRNEMLINLVALKSACILTGAEVRKYAGQSIAIRDGTSAISLQRNPQLLKLMQSTYCEGYSQALYKYKIEGNSEFGEAIVGPFKLYSGLRGGDYGLIDGGSTYGGDYTRDFRSWY